MSNPLTYLGDSSWQPSGNPEYSAPPHELPTAREPWLGASDLTAAFRATYFVGRSYLGGYIIDNTPKSNSPSPGLDSVDLVIALPPDFSTYVADPQWGTKTATLNANVAGTDLIPDAMLPTGADGNPVDPPNPLPCTRTVSFYSPEMRYRYFASSRPTGGRFTNSGSTANPQMLRSTITANVSGGAITFAGNAPAGIVAALFMAPADVLTSTEAQSIEGTPWYRCTDVVSRVYQGDS